MLFDCLVATIGAVDRAAGVVALPNRDPDIGVAEVGFDADPLEGELTATEAGGDAKLGVVAISVLPLCFKIDAVPQFVTL